MLRFFGISSIWEWPMKADKRQVAIILTSMSGKISQMDETELPDNSITPKILPWQ